MSDFETKDRLRSAERELADLRAAVARLPIREAKSTAGDRGRIIYAQVNEVSGVGSGDPTFSFDNAVAIVGGIPAGGTGTAQNQYAQTYANNEFVLLFQEKDSDQWLTERGGESGSQIITAELTTDKTYAQNAQLAKPVLADGTLDSGAPTFYLIDDDELPRYWGLAAYTDGDTEAAAHPGYRYRAVRIVDDWDETGKPGFRIIDGEGPADFIVVILTAAVSSGDATCNLQGGTEPFGGPDASRLPRLENTSFDVTVFDDYDIAGDAAEDDVWIAKWDRASEHYIFWRPVESATGFHVIKGISPGVANTASTFTLGSPVAVQGDLPTGTITVYCDPKITCPAGSTVYGRYDVTKGTDDTDHWSTADAGNSEWILKGYPQYDAGLKQLVTHNASVVEWNDIATVLNWLAAYSSGPDQSIGHDGGDVTRWQNDGECPA